MPTRRKKIRGSGVKLTIRFVGHFSGLWMIVTIGAVVVASSTSFLLFTERFGADTGDFLSHLVFQTLFIVAAVVGLAIFTTHRLAGPWIAVKRALDDVRDGDFDRKLTIRRADPYLREVESSFNGMMAKIRADAGPTDAED